MFLLPATSRESLQQIILQLELHIPVARLQALQTGSDKVGQSGTDGRCHPHEAASTRVLPEQPPSHVVALEVIPRDIPF